MRKFSLAAPLFGALIAGLMALSGRAQPPASSPTPPALTLDQVIQKVQAHYQALKTYQVEFDQELYSASQARVISKGQGVVIYKKPSKMVWHYDVPEDHFYITDGNTLYDYAPADKEAYVMPVKDALYKSFLLGLGDLKKEFEISFHSGRPKTSDGLYQLDLVPRDQEERQALGTITLYLDPQSFQVKNTEMVDALGNRNHVVFKNPKENPDLPDSLFKFSPPPGVNVIKAQDLAPKKDNPPPK